MQPKEYEVHESLNTHAYKKAIDFLWNQDPHNIGYCSDCEGFGELRGNNISERLEVDNALYLRNVRSKLSKSLIKKFDEFLEYRQGPCENKKYREILNAAMGSSGYILAKDLAKKIGNRSKCSVAHKKVWTPMCKAGDLMRYKKGPRNPGGRNPHAWRAAYVLPDQTSYNAFKKAHPDFEYCDPKNKIHF